MKNIRELYQRFFRPRSSIEALKKILPKHMYRTLLLSTPDRRSCFESAARLTGTEVSILLERVAAGLACPVLPRLKPLSDDEKLRAPDMERLKQAAALPLYGDGIGVGIVCVDPALMKAVLPECAHLPVFLSCWTEIEKALSAEGVKSAPQISLFTQVLNHLAAEMKRLDKDACQVLFGEELFYRIAIDSSQYAQGIIHQSASRELREGLFEYADQSKFFEDLNTKLKLKITEEKREELYTLSTFIAVPEVSNVIGFPGVTTHGDTENRLASRTILLVDDNATFTRVLDRFLQKQGVFSIHAADGSQALEILRGSTPPPHVIVCDIHMPIMNGFEFVRILRADPQYQSIPLIMLTSDEDVEAEVTLLSYGVEAFVGKNEDPRILCMHVKRIIERLQTLKAA